MADVLKAASYAVRSRGYARTLAMGAAYVDVIIILVRAEARAFLHGAFEVVVNFSILWFDLEADACST